MVEATYGLPAYAELQCLSNFSFLQGASHPEELVTQAAQLGYSAIAITDECSVAGVVRALIEAEKQEIPLIVGSTLRLQTGTSPHAPTLSLVLLAQTREGYGNLSELITLGRSRAEKGSYRLLLDDITAPGPEYAHLRNMPDCLAILAPEHGTPAEHIARHAQWLAEVFPGRAWLGLTLLHEARDDLHRQAVQQASQRTGLPVTALGHVHMHVRSRKPLHDTLTAIRLKRTVAQCGYALQANAEQHLRSRLRLASLYPAEMLTETVAIARRCTFTLRSLRYEYPDEIVPEGETPTSYLRKEVYAGAERRFPNGIPIAIRDQIEKELSLIAEMQYEPYFLTVYDIVRYARDHHILCQGRGSAANSAVCYYLGITAVDPERSQTLFERFISKERNEPPDIDVDFEHQRREEVIQYIYRKYGRRRAALTGVVISYRPRSVLRDTGRALGIDPGVINAVARAHQWWDSKKGLLRTLGGCGLDPESTVAKHWAILAETLINFPRHLSQHPGGFVIARDNLARLVPIENAAMPDRSVVQWDKDDLDALGLLKVDVLALGMLSVLRRALDLVSLRRGQTWTLPDIPKEDPATYDMICAADTVGVFQIESRAQMSMLPRLRPREYYDLVVQVAIVRPGPIQGGMVHPYLRRRQSLEAESYPSEAVREVLKRTMGVPIFQEQVMQIAMVAADFTPGEADELRRSMAAWRRKGGIDKFNQKLINGLLRNGYTEEFAASIIRQIEGFGEYGFPESHAASFALLAYDSAWLKCHEPEAFLAALLNSQPMGFYAPAQLVQDARRHGVQVLPVDVMVSDWEATLESALPGSPAEGIAPTSEPTASRDSQTMPRPAVRLGFNQIQGLSEAAARRIVQARAMEPFAHAQDLARRANLNRHEMDALAHGDALHTLVGPRRLASWEASASITSRDLLRHADIIEPDTPALPEPTDGQSIIDDYRSLRLSLRGHPLALLRQHLQSLRFETAAVLNTYPDRRLARACGLVTTRQRPQTAKGTVFVTLEDETGPINVVVRAELMERQRRELLGATLLGVYGTWQDVQGIRHLIAQRLVDLSSLLGGLAARSRDFH
ncbi:error-prone DNA polymerase [Bordetella sp. 15P40C-2]|uniref:error-prone DNA polymerase n=1 Tax=Bordetella sp. 15P40C-2 TaxID=2572246 RepID=UPI00132970A9|nr:error-prone DNA polymerase [Bordetella sp. 15P40C-2]MVW70956.1 DNA polymerase III subunit alpha [Bordetella sp. 15P40C-2]